MGTLRDLSYRALVTAPMLCSPEGDDTILYYMYTMYLTVPLHPRT